MSREKKVEEAQEEVMELIRDHKINRDNEHRIKFLVKWQGLSERENTWEDFYFLTLKSPDLIQSYVLESIN